MLKQADTVDAGDADTRLFAFADQFFAKSVAAADKNEKIAVTQRSPAGNEHFAAGNHGMDFFRDHPRHPGAGGGGVFVFDRGLPFVGVFAFFRFDQFPQFDFAAFSPAEGNVNRFFVRGSDAGGNFRIGKQTVDGVQHRRGRTEGNL